MIKKNDNFAVVILAAGMGKRMHSEKAKVLHEVNGKPMVLYVIETAQKIVGDNTVIVVGHQADAVRAVIAAKAETAFAVQEEQLGTGHAVLCALPHIPNHCEDVIILCGDVPLIQSDTIAALIEGHIRDDRDLSLLTVEMENPHGYGRVLLDSNDHLCGIVEEADASTAQKRLKIINTGIYCVKKRFLADALPQLKSENAQGELYLTDIVGIGYRKHLKMGVSIGEDYLEVTGINNTDDLINVENILKRRLRNRS